MRIQLASGIHGWNSAFVEPVINVTDDIGREPSSANVPEKGKGRRGPLVKIKGVGLAGNDIPNPVE